MESLEIVAMATEGIGGRGLVRVTALSPSLYPTRVAIQTRNMGTGEGARNVIYTESQREN